MENTILSETSLAFRYINCQCFEIRLPNGKTLVTDPCYDFPKNLSDPRADLFRLEGFHTEDLEGCDYVLLNHTHGDHISNLEEVILHFSPVVICHSGVAAEIAQACPQTELTSIYPVDYNGTYYFDGFRLQTFHGQHKPQRFTWEKSMAEGDMISQNPRLTRLHTIGGFFNINFLITLDNGFRIGFVGGTDDGSGQWLSQYRPNMVMRNKLRNEMNVESVAQDWFSFMKQSWAQYVVPMHFEVWENQNPGFSEKTFARANELAREAGLACRMVPVRRTQWYRLHMDIVAD